SWVDQVSRMWKLKMGLDQAAESMEKAVASDAGVGDLPIYAKVSVRTSVMGILHYLDKNP
ncbi:MAG: hypothetical protein JRM75_01110, partial [Nitrososphaerota archaeon]|nr:hypothetical protein [Nitrososphaerota archaeon]